MSDPRGITDPHGSSDFAAIGIASDPGPADPRLVARLRALVVGPGPLPATIDLSASGVGGVDVGTRGGDTGGRSTGVGSAAGGEAAATDDPADDPADDDSADDDDALTGLTADRLMDDGLATDRLGHGGTAVQRAHDGTALIAALGALVPAARERHRHEGIPAAVTAATLRDIGRKHDLYGAASVLEWMLGLLRGDVVEVGRLQVERRPGRRGHALHVPESGPLSPLAVDEALDRARRLTGATAFSCESWLLDPALRVELPGSNIAAFAARFDLVEGLGPSPAASEDAAKFVFRRPAAEVQAGGVTPRTRLEHLVATRLRSGAEWSAPLGILRG